MRKSEFIELITKHKFDIPKCIYCEEPVFYENGKYSAAAAGIRKGQLLCYSTTHESTKIINGVTYNLCVCEECLIKKYPDYKEKNKSRVFNQPNKFAQYAFNIPEEEIKKKTHELCARTKETMIKKYGEEEGNRRWNEYCNKQSVTNTFEYKKEKYGWTKDEFDSYNASRAVTQENLIQKYGEEEGLNRFESYRERQRYTCSEEYFIETYGEEEGRLKYTSAINALIIAGLNVPVCSRISIEMFDTLKTHYKHNEIKFGNNNEERVNINNRSYSLDYFDKTLNICVEFNGDYWHCNPNQYSPDAVWKSPYTGELISVKDIWDKDKRRKDAIEGIGIKMFVVWEYDYMKNKDKCISDLVLRINEYTKNTNTTKKKINNALF